MRKPFRSFLVFLIVVGLAAALGSYAYLHHQASQPGPLKNGAKKGRTFDLTGAEKAMERIEEYRRCKTRLAESLEDGVRLLRQFRQNHPGTGEAAQSHIDVARAYAEHGDTAAAMAEIDALLALPDGGRRAAYALLLKAKLLAPTDEAAARAAIAPVLEDARFPDLQMRARTRVGLMDLAKGDYEGAIALLKEVIKTGVPEKAEALRGIQDAVLGKADALAEAKNWQAVLGWGDAQIKEFPDLGPMHHALRFRQAVAHRHLAQFALARVFLERLKRDVPADQLDKGLDAELATITAAEAEAGICRTREVFLKAKEAGQDARAHFEGDIAADTAWGKAKSPLVLTGPVTVKAGATLTIEPGVTVQCLLGAQVVVEGAIVASGTAEAPIRITSAATKAPTFFDGGGIVLAKPTADGQGLVFAHCLFEYQRTGLASNGAEPSVSHCTFARNGVEGLLLADFAELTLADCTFEANDAVGLRSRARRAELTIRRCRVLKNGGDGISLYGKSTVTLETNRIEDNGGSGIACDQDMTATVKGSLIANNTQHGIAGNRLSTLIVTGNELRGNRSAAVRCERDSTCEVVGNTMTGNGTGVALTRSGGTVKDNHILSSRSNSISLADASSPTVEGNWLIGTGGAHIQIGDGCGPQIHGNVFAGWDVGTIGTIGKIRIPAERNYFGPKGPMRGLARRFLNGGQTPELPSITDAEVEDCIFHQKDQVQLAEIVWKPRLTELPPRPALAKLPELP